MGAKNDKEIDAEIDRLSAEYSQLYDDFMTDHQLDQYWHLYDRNRGEALSYLRKLCTKLDQITAGEIEAVPPQARRVYTPIPSEVGKDRRLCRRMGCDALRVDRPRATLCRQHQREYDANYNQQAREKSKQLRRRSYTPGRD